MATVELRFSALPVHVRTARLIAASVARRSGVDDKLLDEVRLAVGEACSRAVGLHQRSGAGNPVEMTLHTDGSRFAVEVVDAVAGDPAAVAAGAGNGASGSEILDADPDAMEHALGLALIRGLVDDVEVRPEPGGAVVRMSWPAGGS